jgi:hypothetical protein
MLLAPFLTISISGLYTLGTADIENKATLRQNDVWELRRNTLFFNAEAAVDGNASTGDTLSKILPGL